MAFSDLLRKKGSEFANQLQWSATQEYPELARMGLEGMANLTPGMMLRNYQDRSVMADYNKNRFASRQPAEALPADKQTVLTPKPAEMTAMPGMGFPSGDIGMQIAADPFALAGTGVGSGAAKAAKKAGKSALKFAGQKVDDAVQGRYSSVLGDMLSPARVRNIVDESPMGAALRSVPQQQPVLDAAREAAERQGLSSVPLERAKQLGFETGWKHGSTGDIKAFDPSRLGDTTGAQSAKRGFFFARDPKNAHLPDGDPRFADEVYSEGDAGAEVASEYASLGGSRSVKDAMREAELAREAGDFPTYEAKTIEAEDAVVKERDAIKAADENYDVAYEDLIDKVRALTGGGRQSTAVWLGNAAERDFLYEKVMSSGNPDLIDAFTKFESAEAQKKFMTGGAEGANVMPIALRYQNPLIKDFKGNSYRDQSYADLLREAQAKGHDAVIMQNTFDPAGRANPLIDVGVVFKPEQIRSEFAAFDPNNLNSKDILAGVGAGAVGAGAMLGSEEAEAAPVKKVTDLLREGGKRMTRAESEAAGLWDDIGGGVKLQRPRSEMSFETTPNPNITIPDRRIVQPEDMQGGVIVPFPGDRTAGGKLLTSINEKPLRTPVTLEGGPDFMRTHNAENAGWASNAGTKFTNMLREAGQKSPDVYGVYNAMGATAGDYSKMMTDSIIAQIDPQRLPKVMTREFDRQMKSLRPEFTSLTDPNLANLMADNGPLRLAFVNTANQKKYQKLMPDIASTRHAITEPALEDVPYQTSGFAIAKMNPEGKIIENPKLPHQTYKSQFEGNYFGGLEKPIPREIMYPKFTQSRRARGGDEAGDRRALEVSRVVEPADQQWVDSVSAYIEKMKREGGAIDPKLLSIMGSGAGTAALAQMLRDYEEVQSQ